MMEKLIRIQWLFLLCLLLIVGCKYKLPERNIDDQRLMPLISNLSWGSFEVQIHPGTKIIYTDSVPYQLENLGKEISPYLIEALKDSSKTVISHILLTQIWEPEVGFAFMAYCENDPWYEDEFIMIYNNLQWYEPNERNVKLPYIDMYDKLRIISYWTNRTKGTKTVI